MYRYREFQLHFSQLAKYLCPIILLILFSCGKNHQAAEKSQPPAKLENVVPESALSTITLSPKAEERLGIEISTVKSRNLPASLKLGGEIISLPGNEVKVAAPVAGTMLKPMDGDVLIAGKFVKEGQEIMRLLLLPPEKDLLGAREDVAVKKKQFELAQAKVNRAEQLLANKAISEKAFEELQVELFSAKAALNAAIARLNLMSNTDLNTAAESLSTLALESPVNGVLQSILVAPGQTVPASTILFEVARLNPVWVRVPIYVGDLAKIDPGKDAIVKPLGTDQTSIFFKAKPVKGPLLSDANSASANLFYEIQNNDKLFRIGQKISVTLIQKSSEKSLVVPWSAILYDIYGGNWVYTRVAPNVYSRRRVEVSHIINEFAVLTRGVKVGDEVVVAGAAEIFGTEFGAGK
jgi:RND family efflux transporter MFP subunit